MAEPRSRDEARKIINRIRISRGIYSERESADLKKLETDFREDLEAGAAVLRKESAGFAKLAALQVYESKHRFIYELIQNADDAKYTKCFRFGEVPSLKFTVNPTEIVIDSNEDGFQVADVQAICATGQSSKAENSNTIGEKGIGFKSVFAIAERVSIFSGHWSFEFRYLTGDDGLGMLVPHWIEPSTQTGGCGSADSSTSTRIILHLDQTARNASQKLTASFEGVPITTLLFLRQLHKIDILLQTHQGQTSVHTFSRMEQWNSKEKSIAVETGGNWDEYLYKMYRQECTVSPKPWAQRIDSPQANSSEVVLGFPVHTTNGTPLIPKEGSHIFAYLPMKRMRDLPFVIHADFAASASRETVIDDPRNERLRDTAAALFACAIEDLCRIPGLKYTWTAFVPGVQLDDFWKPIRGLIKQQISQKAIIAGRQETLPLRTIEMMRTVPDEFQHQEEPLFPSGTFVSEEYDSHAIACLQGLGLKAMTNAEMLTMIERDVQSGPRSRVHNTDLGDPWHDTLAELLLTTFWSDRLFRKRVKKLEILPLSSVRDSSIQWVSSPIDGSSPAIYLPKADETDDAPMIRPDLGLRVLDSRATMTFSRRQLYTTIGIGHVDAKVAVSAALEVNSKHQSALIADYVNHLEILFWYNAPMRSHMSLWVVDGNAIPKRSTQLYFRSDNLYSTDKLLEGSIRHAWYALIHPSYLTCTVRKHVDEKGRSWLKWLESVAGVRTYPEMVLAQYFFGRPALSPLFEEIIERCPSMLVGTLKENWVEYKSDVALSDNILQKLQSALVSCRTGRKQELKMTILPTQVILDKCNLFGVQEKLPLLQIGEDDGPADSSEWNFLRQFGVTTTPNLNFYLEALREMSKLPAIGLQQYVSIYEGIKSVATLDDRTTLQTFFASNDVIYIEDSLRRSSACIWRGPDLDLKKASLAKQYESTAFGHGLFVDLLGIGNATHKDIVNLLVSIRSSNLAGNRLVTLDEMSKILKELERSAWSADGLTSLRDEFEGKSLVFDRRSWHRPSACVWKSPVQLRGRIILHELYPELSSFFNKKLRIVSLSTVTMLEEIIKLCEDGTQKMEEVKSMLREAASMLDHEGPSDKIDSLLRKLGDTKFLPLAADHADPQIYLSAKDDFLINDDERYAGAFNGKATILDLSANEVASMHCLFDAMRLKNKYLSRNMDISITANTINACEDATANMRQRALAIAHCAVSYASPPDLMRILSKAGELQNCTVALSPDICINLKIVAKDIEVPCVTYLAKIIEEMSTIKIILPSDPAGRRKCYRSHLPRQLMEYFGIDAPRAERQMHCILNDPLSDMRELLVEEGITQHPDLGRLDVQYQDRAADLPALEDDVSSSVTYDLPLRSPMRQGFGATSQRATSTPFSWAASTPRVSPFTAAVQADANNIQHDAPEEIPHQYSRVLEHVVRAANTLTGAVTTELPTPADLGMVVGTPVHPEVFKRIGAAGELFVYERLRALDLPGFGRHNWRSNIRHLVCSLPQFEDMLPFTEDETTDIIYVDSDTRFEEILRSSASRVFRTWSRDSNQQPTTFYIEVKTTIRGCNEDFYMGLNQFEMLTKERMIANGEVELTASPLCIYVIARVYDLLSSKVGLKFFVDPSSLKNLDLRFKGGCTVTPI